MRKPLSIYSSVLVALLAALASQARAQRGSPPFEGPRGALSFQLSDGEPVSFYLEWARELEVTDDQRVQLIEVRRKLRVANAPFMKQLDSLRQASGLEMNESRRVSEKDAEALKRFNEWARPVTDSIRVNNDGARSDIRTILQPLQLARADSLFKANRDVRGRRPTRQDRNEHRVGVNTNALLGDKPPAFPVR
ncbi:MAG: hypothetical protein ABIT38_17580 [Gemmatimonadaceae bacterium]